jgi:signal transduction histidine kinase
MVGAVQDITRRKRDEQKLQESAQRLQALSRRLLEVQEQERRHLARELHDEIGQVLAGFKFTLVTSLRLPADDLRASLEEAQGIIKDLQTRVRDLSMRLRPPMLDDFGLLPALLWHVERYTAQTKIHVALEHHGLEERFHPDVETAAYRLVQEALTNVARHAGVPEATVRIWLDHDLLYLQIADQGVGFDAAAVLGAGTANGLSGMRERANLLDGWLRVESTPGRGTCITAALPIRGPEET